MQLKGPSEKNRNRAKGIAQETKAPAFGPKPGTVRRGTGKRRYRLWDIGRGKSGKGASSPGLQVSKGTFQDCKLQSEMRAMRHLFKLSRP